MWSVKATTHQGNAKYLGAGNQCVANSYASMLYSKTKQLSEWTAEDLDKVLECGDKLFQTTGLSTHLLITDLPEVYTGYKLSTTSTCAGSVYTKEIEAPFKSVIQSANEIKVYSFLTFKSSTLAIIKSDQLFYVFDPHSRGSDGMLNSKGTAVLTVHKSSPELLIFLENLCTSLGGEGQVVPFEMTHVQINDSDLESDIDFDGYSYISDGEYSCLMMMAEESLADEMRKIKEENEEDLDSMVSVCSESDFEENIPLAQLIKTLQPEVLESDSESSVLESSGSEYELTLHDRKILDENLSETDSDASTINLRNSLNKFEKGKVKKMHRDIQNVIQGDSQVEHQGYGQVENMVGSEVKCQGDRQVGEQGGSQVGDKEDNQVGYQGNSQDQGNSQVGYQGNSQVGDKGGSQVGYQGDSQVVDKEGSQVGYQGGSQVVGKGDSQVGNHGDCQVGNQGDSQIGGQGDSQVGDKENSQVGDKEDTQVGYQRNSQVGGQGDNQVGGLGDSYVGDQGGDHVGNRVESMIGDQGDSQVGGQENGMSGVQGGVPEGQRGDLTGGNRGRKRVRNEKEWARNVAKRCKNSGKEFINHLGSTRHSRNLKKGCGMTCRYKCHFHISQENRESIFDSFWGLSNVTSQRQFLLKYAGPKQKATTRLKSSSRRANSFAWSLPCGGTVRVCKTFFLQTLSISDQMVQTALQKSDAIPGVCEPEKRGKHSTRPNRTPPLQVSFIKRHIESFPKMESHYCRKDSKKMYLSPELSVPKMYRLYVEECARHGLQPVKESVYRLVFNSQYNYAFHRPKKDQCDLCSCFQNLTQNEKEQEKGEYQLHRHNANLARTSKDTDKAKAKEDEELVVACFDLQEVLMTPKGFASSFYYKRRLSTFNFTIYNLATTSANCYIWNESISGRGACDIASCVFSYVETMVQKGKRKFIFYSDNCWSQNKNRFYAAMIWYAVQKFHLEYIHHKYLEKGHTQNENDSVHATIERASRYVSVFTTPQWAAIISAARARSPYIVKEMDSSNFLNFKQVADQLKNFDLDLNRNKVFWSRIRTMKITIEHPHLLIFQYDYEGSLYYLNLTQRRHRSHEVPHPRDFGLENLHLDRPKIKRDKYRDLLQLCQSGMIPRVHHAFYLWLPHEIE